MTVPARRGWFAWSSMMALCASCRSEAAASRPPPTPSAQALAPSAPSFKRDVLPVLTRHCADAKGCHGVEPTDSVDLDLTPGSAYRELVSHPSDVRTGALRVSPGEPERSFLLDKLAGRLQHDEGKRMPIDVDTGVPVEPNPVPQTFVDNVLIPWIRAGAKDD